MSINEYGTVGGSAGGPPGVPPPGGQKKQISPLVWVLLISGFFFAAFVGIAGVVALRSGGPHDWESEGKLAGESSRSAKHGSIAVLELKGVISDSRKMLRLLKKAEKDSSIKAVVLRLDSPGGAVPPSQEIYGAVKAFQKPVIVSMGNVAASGAFYIAMGAKSIYANPGTLTGSVGVILSMMNLQKLFEWAKIEPVVVKSGKFKDVPSPNRPMTAEERAYLQATIDEVQGQFRAAVKEGRKLTDADLDRFADGRVMTGSQALRLKLVDKLGGIQEAIVEAGKIAGIEGDPHVVYPQRKRERLLDLLTEFRPDDEDEDGEASTKGLQGLQQPLQALTDRMTTGLRPGLYWLWDGGL